MSAPLSWVGTCLRESGYTPEALKQLLSVTSPDDVGLLNHAAALERIADDSTPVAALARLFFLEAPEPLHTVVAALTRRRCTDLIELGLLQRRQSRVQARVRIDPVGEQYVLSDRRFGRIDRGALHLPAGDPVYPPSTDSLLLRDAIAAPHARTLLDVCTGSGIQALQRAAVADQLVATDINVRAAAMATLNAALNGIQHCTVHTGDLYRPIRRDRFDLIIANPPFVASPHQRGPSYHAGGRRGDRVLRRVIAGWARHLTDGGRAFAVSHVALDAHHDLEFVAREWFRNFPGRALVLSLETGTPVDLAAAQSLFALDRGLRSYAAEVHRWVRYLRRSRITQVVAILIAAQHGAERSVEVVDAAPRILPLPLSPPPTQRITNWFEKA